MGYSFRCQCDTNEFDMANRGLFRFCPGLIRCLDDPNACSFLCNQDAAGQVCRSAIGVYAASFSACPLNLLSRDPYFIDAQRLLSYTEKCFPAAQCRTEGEKILAIEACGLATVPDGPGCHLEDPVRDWAELGEDVRACESLICNAGSDCHIKIANYAAAFAVCPQSLNDPDRLLSEALLSLVYTCTTWPYV